MSLCQPEPSSIVSTPVADISLKHLAILILLSILTAGCGGPPMPESVPCTTLPTPAHGPEAMGFDVQGHLWLVYGISRLDGAVELQDPSAGQCVHFTRENVLDMKDINALTVDAHGHVWLGGWSKGDLARYDGMRWHTNRTYDGSADDGNTVLALATAPNGDVWVGVPRYAYQFNGKTWHTYTADDGLPLWGITAITVAPDGTVWFGGQHRPADDPRACKLVSYDGQDWTSACVADELVDGDVTAIAVTESGTIWIGTDQGLTYVEQGHWITTHTDVVVNAIAVDNNDQVWVATGDQRVLTFDAQTWTAYGTVDGLPDDEITALAVAPDGSIWAGTSTGVSRFSQGTWAFRPIGEP